MFGLSNLQIYGLQPSSNNHHETTNGMKVTASFLEKLIRNELLLNNNSNSNHNNNNSSGSSSGSNENRNGNDLKKNVNGLIDTNKTCHQQKTILNGIKEGKGNDDVENNNNNSNDKYEKCINKEIKETMTKVTITENGSTNSSGTENEIMINSINGSTSDRNSNEMVNETNQQNGNKIISPDMQRRKFMQMITFLDQENQRLKKELTKEKRRRGEELSKIIKSLLCFEAKLKHDKKVINQNLYEKDNEICRLINLNKVLKRKYGANDQYESELDNELTTTISEVQFCPNCRKEFYGIEQNHSGTQTQSDGDKEDQTEHGSSSDETVSSSFYGARRSIRYTSKRTFGTFRDYMRSRSMMVDDSNLDNSEENTSTLSRDESQYSCFNKSTNAYSRTIDRLHGVRRVESFEADLDSECEGEHQNEKDYFLGNPDDKSSSRDDDRILSPEQSSEKKCSAKEFAETSPKQEFETSTDDWYASASDVEENDNVRAKPYMYNAVNPVLECVNQILLQQSMEECINDGPPSLESNENNSGSGGSVNKEGTVTRKRVHFSTKNSMVHVPRDDISSPINDDLEISNQKENSFNYESIYSNEYEPIGSEHNSSNLYVDMESKLGQDDRAIVPEKPKPPALPPKPANLMKIRRVLKIPPQPFPIHKIETKIEDKSESEPDYCSISEVNEAITSVQIVVDVHKPPEDDQSDALSQKTDDVEEIFADIPKLPNVAAIMAPKAVSKFINNDNYVMKSSPIKDENVLNINKTPTKANIPKILADINKKIATSTPAISAPPSSSNKSQLVPSFSPTKPNITTASISATQSPSSSSSSMKIITTEDKLPLQAEFDWYNLDAEYGKSNQPDVIKATDVNTVTSNGTDKHHDGLTENTVLNGQIAHGVEYNLDEEFSLTNQPDIIKENVRDAKIINASSSSSSSSSSTSSTSSSTSTTSSASSKPTICDRFPTIVDQTPCARRVKLRTDFTNFIENSGLSTKPLPRQRKIYFSGPFV